MSKNKKQGRDAARPEARGSSEEIVALVKERRKYADWIAALDAKKDQTPAAVYGKVRLDYETRLQAAVEKLESHREALAEEQASLSRKLEGVQGQIEHHQEQRAETELRAQIGELSAAALTEALRESDTELERLEDKRDALEADLARLADFFAALDGGGPTGRTSAPKLKTRGFDELSFLQSVVGDKPSPPRSAPPQVKAESAPPLKPVDVPSKPPVEVPAPRPSRRRLQRLRLRLHLRSRSRNPLRNRSPSPPPRPNRLAPSKSRPRSRPRSRRPTVSRKNPRSPSRRGRSRASRSR
jgi:hypothetical protein